MRIRTIPGMAYPWGSPIRAVAAACLLMAAAATGCGSSSSAPTTGSAGAGQSTSPTSQTSSSTTTTPARHGPIHVTFVGDSVPASIDYVPEARKTLDRGLRMKLDLKVCRRLVAPSCPYDGSTPTTALQAIRGYGPKLGDVLIVDVGYNDYSGTYRDQMREVIKQADAQGVRGIVWVTMRQARSSYDWTNHVIKTEARKWPNVSVADWNSESKGKPWFGSDGLHLDDSGADHLASFLRPYIYRAAEAK
jgi:hypothetical protein